MDSNQPRLPVELTTSQSWGLLREAEVGRLAVVVDGQPDIFPVNYRVDQGSILIRTSAGTKLSAAAGQRVAFEVDAYLPATGEAWSVIAKGTAREVQELYELLDALELPQFAWHAAPKRRVLRIEPDVISGRRFHVAAP